MTLGFVSAITNGTLLPIYALFLGQMIGLLLS